MTTVHTRSVVGRALALVALVSYLMGPALAVADDTAADLGADQIATGIVDDSLQDELPPSDEPGDADVATDTEEQPKDEAELLPTDTVDEGQDVSADDASEQAEDVDETAGQPADPDETPNGALPASAASKLIGKVFALKSKKGASFVLGIKGASTAKLATTQIETANGSLFERWCFKDAGDGFVRIINLGSGMALDVSYGKVSKGQVVWQYPDNGSAAQRWYPVEVSSGSFVFVSALSGNVGESGWYVLDIYAGTMKSGQAVNLWSYNKSVAQQWTLAEDTTDRAVSAADIVAFASKHAGTLTDGQQVMLAPKSGNQLVLDVAGASVANKANVQGYTSNSTDAQIWTVQTDAAGFVTLVNKKSGKVLDIANGSATAGSNVWQYTSNGSMAQKWVASKVSDGTVILWSALGRGLVLDMANGGTTKGTNVRVWTSNGSSAQRFVVVSPSAVASTGKSIENGFYTINLSGSTFLVDIKGGSRIAGVAAQLYSPNGSLSQAYYITYCVTDGYYRIQSVLSHKNLSVGANMLPGAPVTQEEISGTSKGQCWNIISSDGGYKIVSALSGQALAATATTKGTNLVANDSAAKKTWTFETATPSISTGIYKIVSTIDYATVLEVANGSSSAGAQVQAAKSGVGYEQRFYISKQSDGTYAIESVNSSKAISSATSGKVTQQAIASQQAQRWKLEYTPFGYKFVSASTGKAISLSSAAAGTKATQADGRAAGQSFYVTSAKAYDNGCHLLVTRIDNSRVVDVASGSIAAGANVQLWNNNGTPAQKWQLNDAGSGYVTIIDVKSSMALGVKGNSATKGANVEQQTPSSAKGQRWKVEYVSGGYRITSALGSNLVLDVSGAKSANGANLQLWTSNNTVAQLWGLAKTSPGVIIALDPGHGGDDSGAVGSGLREADLTWAITQACATQLRNYGYAVYITKTKGESVTISDRVTRAANHGATCVISIHIDAGGGNGAQVLVPNSSAYHHEFYTQGQRFAKILLPKINALGIGTHGDGAYERNYSLSDGAEENRYYSGGGLQDYYGIVRYARLKGMLGMIIEHGFIDSSDANLLRQSAVQTALGKADAAAIRELYG